MAMTSLLKHLILLLLLHLLLTNHPTTTAAATTSTTNNLYSSPSTFFSDYQNMLTNLKIFIYPPPQQEQIDNNSTFSLFYNSILSSPFITNNSNDATLFFIPFPPLSTRSLARHLEYIRTSYSHWTPSLGADHFYFSCRGVGRTSTRDVVELKKNSIRVSCFPSPAREFIPHKDITFLPTLTSPRASKVGPTRRLGYWRFTGGKSSVGLIKGLKRDEEFLIESEPSDEDVSLERVKSSKFCLFGYENVMVGLSVALAHGCVPVVITDRPIQDLPLMDLIRWSEIAVFVGSSIGPDKLKTTLMKVCKDGAYEKMRGLSVAAAHHFVWNVSSPQPYDAFHMVMYQLWRRRHAIRYATWQVESV